MTDSIDQIIHAFESSTGLHGVQHSIKERSDGRYAIIFLANPSERYFAALREAASIEAQGDLERITLKKLPKNDLLQSPEGKLFLRTLSESLNINRHSFGDDFFARYTKSVSSAEEQITALSNHVVFGRRGAGKSSLLLYALHTRNTSKQPSVWVDMQTFKGRSDSAVVADVIEAILEEVESLIGEGQLPPAIRRLQATRTRGAQTVNAIRKIIPEIKKILSSVARDRGSLFVLLDDFHVLDPRIQPLLLDCIYSFSRGAQVFIKLSAIESLTRTYEADSHSGLQIPHDAQAIKLDLNLTVPDKAAKHIESILNSHAEYCALPSIRSLCTSGDVLNRLVWVSAGVPRDALSIFSQAMTKAVTAGRKKISVTNINVAASETVNQKLKDLDLDVAGSDSKDKQVLFEKIKDFCVKKEKVNAFLVEIQTKDEDYKGVLELVDLRLLHVISEGITPHEAGRKFVALILDYGFYTGIRAARSVQLFNQTTKPIASRELRSLPVFTSSSS